MGKISVRQGEKGWEKGEGGNGGKTATKSGGMYDLGFSMCLSIKSERVISCCPQSFAK